MTGITADNPAGTDGFEFVEFAGPDPGAIHTQFHRMGYAHVATHRDKVVELRQQADVTARAVRTIDGLAHRRCSARAP